MAGSLQPLVGTYLTGKRARREIGVKTWRRQRGVLGTLAVSYGARPVSRLSRADLHRWIALRARSVAPGTLRTDWGTVRTFTAWLTTEGHVRRDPAIGIRPPYVPRAVRRGYTLDDLEKLWPVLPDLRAGAVVALMAGSALRISEACTVELGDYDPHARTVTVRQAKWGHQRVEPVPRWAAERIDAYLATVPNVAGVPLIRSLHDDRSPVSPEHISRRLHGWLVAAGLKQRPGDGNSSHAFRRGCARRCVERNPDLRVVQHLLGHTGLTNLGPYVGSVTLEQVRRAIDDEPEGDAA